MFRCASQQEGACLAPACKRPSESPLRTAFAHINPHLSVVEIAKGETLAEPFQPLTRGYFLHSGILSLLVDLPGGGGAETGVTGRDGVFGAIQAFDHGQSLNRVTVQIAGEASVIPLPELGRLLMENTELRKAIISYKLYAFAQAQQNVACNAHHTVQQKLCKWLTRTHDLVGDDLPLAQEFIAIMIGVRRTSVSDAARELHKVGMIDYSRGKIRVISKDKLEKGACECARHFRELYRRAFDPEVET